MTALALRSYQSQAVEAAEAAWARGVRRPVIVAATGAGKTQMFAHLAHRHATRRRSRVLVLAHRVELIDQAARRIRDVDPDLRVGTVIADCDETDADVVVASVQTLRLARRRARLNDIGLIITDECHHASSASYRAIYDDFPDALGLGVTATPQRADGIGLDSVFDEIVAEIPILGLIKQGFLADIRGIRVEVADLDLSAVKTRGGDFVDGQLGEAMEMSMAPEVVTAAYLEHAADRAGILFAPTVAVAEIMAHHLNGAGIVTEVVTGATPKTERKAMLRRFEAGRTQVLANCAVLTEGTDLPIASCVVMARPTKSSSLFIQMAGRVLRPYPGKEHALLLDVAGATAANGLCSMATLAGRQVKPGRTLTEAEADEAAELEEEASRPAREKPIHAGPVGAREVDLFAAARRRWRKTAGGLPYLTTPVAYLFVLPGADGDGYDIGWLATHGRLLNGRAGGNVREGLSDLSAAMAWAEQAADEADPTGMVGEKDRRWHRKAASEKQLGYARALGLSVAAGMRAVEVSDLIDARLASRTIDPRILPFLAQSGRLPVDEPVAVG